MIWQLLVCSGSIATNGKSIGEVAEIELQMFNKSQMMIKEQKLNNSTETAILPMQCYMPLILDACCSTRSFWFDKNDDRVLFHDLRNETYHIKPDKSHPKRTLVVKPDVVGDFTKMVFDDNTFQLVVFDPPFIKFGENSVMAKTYGTLKNVNWQEMISKGFAECFRVLKPNGILVFKWDEYEIPIKEILKLTNQKPLFGHISGKRSQTHWVCFMKCDVSDNGI